MSALSVNLKLLYQRKVMWVFGLLIIMLFCPSLVMRRRSGYAIIYLFLNVALGGIAGSMHKDTMTKTVSFLLPRHQSTSRAFIFIIGVLSCIVTAFVVIFFHHPANQPAFISLISYAAFGMAFYLLSAAMVFYFARSNMIGFIPAVYLLFLLGKWQNTLDFIIASMWAGLPFCVAVCFFVWRLYGRRSLARKACSGDAVTIFDAFNIEKMQAVRQRKLSRRSEKEKHQVGWAERFFPARMESYPPGGASRYVWGALYETCGVFPVKNLLFMVIFMPFFVIWLGFLGGAPIFPLMHIILSVQACMIVNMSGRMNLPRCAGRRERFAGRFSVVIFAAVVAMALLTLMMALSSVVTPVMPDITLGRMTFSFQGQQWRYAYLPLLIMPLGFTGNVLFPRSKTVDAGMMAVLFPAAMLCALFLTNLGPAFITALVVSVWGLFIYGLWKHCMKRPLVGRG